MKRAGRVDNHSRAGQRAASNASRWLPHVALPPAQQFHGLGTGERPGDAREQAGETARRGRPISYFALVARTQSEAIPLLVIVVSQATVGQMQH
jgi:hypothetical protein